MGSVYLIAAIMLMCAVGGHAQIQRFSSGVTVTERSSETSDVIRAFDTVMYYDNAGDNETLLFETDVPALNISVFELNIYQDRFIRFSWCEETCGWEDLFGQTMPRLWCPSSGGESVEGDDINGVPASELVQHTSGSVTMWCRASDLEPVAALRVESTIEIHYAFDFPVEQSLPSEIFEAPDFCPEVDSSCFRLDLAIVLDHSGSIILNWWDQVEFVLDLVSEFTISEKAFKVSVISYAGTFNCSMGLPTSTLISPLTGDKEDLIESIRIGQRVPPKTDNRNCVNGTGWFTATVKGVSAAFDQLQTFGRIATNRAVLVVTDGNGNRPRSPLVGLSVPSTCGGTQWITAHDGADDDDDDSDNTHDDWLCYMYQCRFIETNAVIYAIGVGAVSVSTINRIAANSGTDCSGIGGGGNSLNVLQERGILLTGFDALGDVTFDLSEQLLCSSASQAPCEDSCRPGGFCCGGECICIEDCSAVGDECQTGECVTSSLGTFCIALGKPCSSGDDQTPAIVGGVLGGLFAVCCLFTALIAIILLSILLTYKVRRDVQVYENAFAHAKNTDSNPLFVSKHLQTDNPMYET